MLVTEDFGWILVFNRYLVSIRLKFSNIKSWQFEIGTSIVWIRKLKSEKHFFIRVSKRKKLTAIPVNRFRKYNFLLYL